MLHHRIRNEMPLCMLRPITPLHATTGKNERIKLFVFDPRTQEDNLIDFYKLNIKKKNFLDSDGSI
uniref:Uncharacterized protein n=1 Tax=Picea glauca TaxID=3330 RepID=A0A117NGY5_PICGL|nr:hypothetical protein ABT39_MTgene5699 [Picea glauca]QHR90633.1 hypothetical protein Q903MT_gene4658 [Picea sitchensis]